MRTGYIITIFAIVATLFAQGCDRYNQTKPKPHLKRLEKNIAAKEWLEPAMAGNTYAQYELGKSYCCGTNGIHDNEEATKWLCKAARSGETEAQKFIGDIYRSDKKLPILQKASGLPNNDILSYSWYVISERNGNKEAAQESINLRKNILTTDYFKAGKYIRKFPNIPCEINNN